MLVIVAVALLAAPSTAAAPGDSWSLHAASEVSVEANLVYRRASGMDLKLDVYTPYPAAGPKPTVIVFHGGGWVEGSKEKGVLALLPYLERGFAAVNVGYRLGSVELAPAAVEDGRCAVRWVIENAATYGFDPERVVVTGWSAGGHLALTSGLLDVAAGFDRTCAIPGELRWSSPAQDEVKVAAVVNWFGITDVADLLEGTNGKHYAIEWLGSRSDRRELADRVSPLQYVRAGAPPILSVHGDKDSYVPYSHAVRLHAALDKAGVPNRLWTVKGGGHGDFSRDEESRIYEAIFEFLGERGLLPKR
jgi:acetyl esterase/lipase